MVGARVRRFLARLIVRGFAAGCVGVLVLAGPVATVSVGAVTFGSVSGRVVDGSGHGVANLHVGIPAASSIFAVTDANGSYNLAVPTAATAYSVLLLAPCSGNGNQTKRVVVDGAETVNFTVGAPLKIAGYTCAVTAQPYINASHHDFTGDDFQFDRLFNFDFPFFGAKRDDRFTFDSNGVLTLPHTSTSYYNNQTMPQTDAPNGIIAPFWDDIVWDASSHFGDGLGGTAPHRYVLVEWNNVLFNSGASSERVSFEVVMYEDGRILFNYDGIDSSSAHLRERGSSATVGIESPDGTKAFALSYNEVALDNGLAIMFTPAPK
jgi:hypothetical protein